MLTKKVGMKKREKGILEKKSEKCSNKKERRKKEKSSKRKGEKKRKVWRRRKVRSRIVERKEENLNPQEQVKRLLKVRNLFFGRWMEARRGWVMNYLVVKFRKLSYCDLEEVFDDGCLVMWNKMTDVNFKLKEESLDGYLIKVCWNIGMHYLRKVNNNVLSLDKMMERNGENNEVACSLDEVFEVFEKKKRDEERYEMIKKMWEQLSEIDRMILESYYLDGCKMNDIAKKIGYKNGNSVKSRKLKVLKKMIKRMKEEEED